MESRDRDLRLAVYGSLAPGRVNHHQLADLGGRWLNGTVRGRFAEAGWGAAIGFPGLILDSTAPEVEVQVFESSDLPDHWTRLDEFEGESYERVATEINTSEGVVRAWIYVVART